MPPRHFVYLYGMVVQSTIHKMRGSYPTPDEYGEIAQSHFLPGGEAGNSAVVLNRLGYRVKLDGPYLGTRTHESVPAFYNSIGVDCSGMHYDPEFAGVEDMVIVAGNTRTVFGTYADFYSKPGRWTEPDEDAIAAAQCIGLDPYFMPDADEVAQLCVKFGNPYVTIDCPPHSFLSRNAAAVVISGEFIRRHFPEAVIPELMAEYTQDAVGLIIFTSGSKDISFGRRGARTRHFRPYKVDVVSTLGAGDTFRAGIMHGILQGWSDLDVVKFGAATAACVCTKFPIGLNPPSMGEIMGLMAAQIHH